MVSSPDQTPATPRPASSPRAERARQARSQHRRVTSWIYWLVIFVVLTWGQGAYLDGTAPPPGGCAMDGSGLCSEPKEAASIFLAGWALPTILVGLGVHHLVLKRWSRESPVTALVLSWLATAVLWPLNLLGLSLAL